MHRAPERLAECLCELVFDLWPHNLARLGSTQRSTHDDESIRGELTG